MTRIVIASLSPRIVARVSFRTAAAYPDDISTTAAASNVDAAGDR
jgi:hypothetical protein